MKYILKLVFGGGFLICFLISEPLVGQTAITLAPRGMESALLGNNGIALDGSSSAGAINPASLVGINNSRISAASSVLSVARYNNFSNARDRDRTKSAQIQLGSPYIFSQFPVGNFYLSVFAAEDFRLRTTKYIELELSGQSGSRQFEIDYQVLRLGAILGGKLSNWSWGISPMIYLIDSKSQTLEKLFSVAESSSFFSQTEGSASVFSIRAGSIFKFESLRLGFYFEGDGKQISTSEIQNNLRTTTTGLTEDTSGVFEPARLTPSQVAIGVKLDLKNEKMLVFDATLVNETKGYEPTSVSDLDESTIIGKQTKLGFGYRWQGSNEKKNSFGMQYSWGDARQGGYTTSLYANYGVSIPINYVNSLINVYYSGLRKSGDSEDSIQALGLSLGTEYSF